MLFCCYHFVFTQNVLSYLLSILHCVTLISEKDWQRGQKSSGDSWNYFHWITSSNYFAWTQQPWWQNRYRKVASSIPVYYSILNHFWGATNWDVLLTETCYYCHVQQSIKKSNHKRLHELISICTLHFMYIRGCQIGMQGPQLCAEPRHFCKLDVATSRIAFLDLNLHVLQVAPSNSKNWGRSVVQNCTSDTP